MATLFARLEEAGYRRDTIGKLTREYVHRVIFHPRDKQGRLKPAPAKGEPFDHANHVRRSLLRRKLPGHLIEERVREVLAKEAARKSRQGGKQDRFKRR